jgi:hypothetical protein
MPFYVERVEPCAVCDESGWVQHPAWALYWAEHSEGLSGVDQDMQWFRGQGWPVYCEDDLPPEEVECSECDGTGFVSVEYDLRDALREISSDESGVRSQELRVASEKIEVIRSVLRRAKGAGVEAADNALGLVDEIAWDLQEWERQYNREQARAYLAEEKLRELAEGLLGSPTATKPSAQSQIDALPVVVWFAERMGERLLGMGGGWNSAEISYLMRRLGMQHERLGEVLARGTDDPQDVVGEAAQVAVYALLIADRWNRSRLAVERVMDWTDAELRALGAEV